MTIPGLMMEQPLLISSLLVHAERHHGDQEIVSRRVEGDIHRQTYRDLAARSRRVANALAALGVKEGDEVEVKVIEVGRDGKIRLSRRELLPLPEGEEGERAKARMDASRNEGPPPRRDGDRPRGDRDRGGRGRR